jgi:hypothetical protein
MFILVHCYPKEWKVPVIAKRSSFLCRTVNNSKIGFVTAVPAVMEEHTCSFEWQQQNSGNKNFDSHLKNHFLTLLEEN